MLHGLQACSFCAHKLWSLCWESKMYVFVILFALYQAISSPIRSILNLLPAYKAPSNKLLSFCALVPHKHTFRHQFQPSKTFYSVISALLFCLSGFPYSCFSTFLHCSLLLCCPSRLLNMLPTCLLPWPCDDCVLYQSVTCVLAQLLPVNYIHREDL